MYKRKQRTLIKSRSFRPRELLDLLHVHRRFVRQNFVSKFCNKYHIFYSDANATQLTKFWVICYVQAWLHCQAEPCLQRPATDEERQC